MRRFGIKKYLPFFIIIIVFFLDERLAMLNYLPKDKWYILVFFIAIFIINESLIFLAFANNKNNFIPFYLSTVAVRMILSMFFLFYFIFQLGNNSYAFVICFLLLYLFFTLFEILDINRKLRRFSEDGKIVEKK